MTVEGSAADVVLLEFGNFRVLDADEIDGELEIKVETAAERARCRACGVRALSKGRATVVVRDVELPPLSWTHDFEIKKNRILELYDIADGKRLPGEGDPTVVLRMDQFGPLNLQPHPGRQWAAVGGKARDPTRPPRRRRRATYKRPHGVRHLLAAYDLGRDRL